MTRYSATADCGKGLPRAESIAEAPPRRMLFFWLTPSMKMLMLLRSWPPPRTVTTPLESVSKRTPGARSAKDRKLRVVCGMAWMVLLVTLVPTSELRTSLREIEPVITTSCVAPAPTPIARSTAAVSPTLTVMTCDFCSPTRSSYEPGGRPAST